MSFTCARLNMEALEAEMTSYAAKEWHKKIIVMIIGNAIELVE